MDKKKRNRRIRQYISFIVCFILMGVVAVAKNGKLFGIELHNDESTLIEEPIIIGEQGSILINTTSLTKDIIGYSGPTPVEITVQDGKIVMITPLKNQETPEFFGAVMNSTLFENWYGKTLEEAADIHPDAVTGATITSTAIIRNIEAGVAYAQDKPLTRKTEYEIPLDFKFFCVIAVILAASILPLFIKDKRYRVFQLTINVLLLGFWGGTFINYTLMTSLMANGIKTYVMLPVLLMLVTAFFYPFFGKKDHYCNWICPYGSVQELAGKSVKFKLRMSPKLIKRLTLFREVLWVGLMIVMWTGLWFDWMNWEPFAAFYFNEVSAIVYSIAGGFLLLSFVVQRPYCRFVCPTGTLFKMSEDNR